VHQPRECARRVQLASLHRMECQTSLDAFDMVRLGVVPTGSAARTPHANQALSPQGQTAPALQLQLTSLPSQGSRGQWRGRAGCSFGCLNRLYEWLDLIRSYEHENRTLGNRHSTAGAWCYDQLRARASAGDAGTLRRHRLLPPSRLPPFPSFRLIGVQRLTIHLSPTLRDFASTRLRAPRS
jgi:hypothetical protein